MRHTFSEALSGLRRNASMTLAVVVTMCREGDAETIATLGYLRRRCPTTPVAVLLTSERGLVKANVLRSLSVDLRIDLSELCLYLALLPQELFVMAHTVLGLPNYQR